METKSKPNPQSPSNSPQPKFLKTPLAEPTAPNFPDDIIAEILSRLPVKSLLRFKRVSKSWRALISGDQFVRDHLRISKDGPNFTGQKIITTILLPSGGLKQVDLRTLLHGPHADATESRFPMKNPGNSFRIVGCCDGLVCLAVNGFSVPNRYQIMAKVYSLKADSWKKVEIFNHGLQTDDGAKFVGGKLHWGKKAGLNWEIVSFDLATETLGKVELPFGFEGFFPTSLGILGGCLCVLRDFREMNLDVWVLKHYGVVGDSWVKMASIHYDIHCVLRKGPYPKPLCVGPTGEVLFVCGSSFVIWDPSGGGRFRCPEATKFGPFVEADVYTESLVSFDH
ncbi:F-box family protein [Striga asiatica]|uniref:F-box family protein n=1 Tax=Striga asiatica TaxID=4170 RepID=A0A5A7P5U8_STRAF|nr:F-box family protein [Striga asiatica]